MIFHWFYKVCVELMLVFVTHCFPMVLWLLGRSGTPGGDRGSNLETLEASWWCIGPRTLDLGSWDLQAF